MTKGLNWTILKILYIMKGLRERTPVKVFSYLPLRVESKTQRSRSRKRLPRSRETPSPSLKCALTLRQQSQGPSFPPSDPTNLSASALGSSNRG